MEQNLAHFDPAPTHVGRPIAITAQQWDGTKAHAELLCSWADLYQGRGSACYIAPDHTPHSARPARLVIHTSAGTMTMLAGEWLVKGTEDEFYPAHTAVMNFKYQDLRAKPPAPSSISLTPHPYALNTFNLDHFTGQLLLGSDDLAPLITQATEQLQNLGATRG